MTDAFHIAALVGLSLSAAYWLRHGIVNTALKLGFVVLSAWAAVVVAMDFVGRQGGV